ncbi:hypothetical protein JCM17823_16370 [Halorubrum gandharaense]
MAEVAGVLRCPDCETALNEVSDPGPPAFVDGRMQLDVACPDCDAALRVAVEAVHDDGIRIRKQVERV